MVFYGLVLFSVGTMIGMRQIPALGIAIPQLLNIRFVVTLTNVFLVFSTFINLTDFAIEPSLLEWCCIDVCHL